MDISEELLHSTIRIETNIGSGTGFFFDFAPDNNSSIPCLVTNKHVINGASQGLLIFAWRNVDGNPVQDKYSITIDAFDKDWILHPEDDVDLCIYPLAPILNMVHSNGVDLFFKALNRFLIPSEEVIDNLSHIETITMIGYPNGLWDEFNGLPIVRAGITATPFKYDYLGQPEFVTDAACFPGSSGSPVFIFNQGGYSDGNGFAVGSRLLFLGVLHSGPTINARGDITINTSAVPHVETQMMINLGNVVKSKKLLDFDSLLGIGQSES